MAGKYVKGDKRKPLHQCNFFGSLRAGDKLAEMMKLGSSRPWKEVSTVSRHTLHKYMKIHGLDVGR